MSKAYPTALPYRFGRVEDEYAAYEKVKAVILPVPLDRTTSWKRGTRKGPSAIIEASHHMELYDEELGRETYREFGLATLEEMDTDEGTLEQVLAHLHTAVLGLLEDGKFPVILGGEHGLTPPCVSAAAKKFKDLCVLQIDAHADLRQQYHGNPNSHASAMRRSLEVCPAVQVGIRSLSEEEAELLPSLPTKIFWAHDILYRPTQEWVEEVVAALSPNVYLTVDLDAFDPAYMPATGTPEPGGLDWYRITDLLRAVMRERNVVAMDVVELLPTPGLHHADFLAAKLIYRALGYRFCLPR